MAYKYKILTDTKKKHVQELQNKIEGLEALRMKKQSRWNKEMAIISLEQSNMKKEIRALVEAVEA